MKIRAAVARAYLAPLAIEGLDLREPREGELLVRLVASGVAHADRDAVAGAGGFPLPFVPGCEAAGIVEKVGPGIDGPPPGAAVLVVSVPAIVQVANDLGQLPGSASPFEADGAHVHGFCGQSSFATHLVCRAADVVQVAADLPLEVLAALPGEFLAGAAPVLRWARDPGDAVVVTGAGYVGLAACMAARALGIATVIVADPDEKRRKLALEFGATLAVPADGGLPAVVRSVVADGAHLAVEASGGDDALDACVKSLRTGGVCATTRPRARPAAEQLATGTDAQVVDANGSIAAHELVPRLLALYAEGALPLERLISFFQFEHVNEALQALEADPVVKPVIRFPLGSFGALDRARSEGAASQEADADAEATSEPSRQEAGDPTEPTEVARALSA